AASGTQTVTNLNDSGTGSLRGAIDAAAATDTIIFSTGIGSITLTSGSLVVSKNLTFTGPGAPFLAINGNNAFRVFNIQSDATVSVSGFTLMNGNAGANRDGGGISSLNGSGHLSINS